METHEHAADAAKIPAYLGADGGDARLVWRLDECDVWAVRRKVAGYDSRPAYARESDPGPHFYWTAMIQTMPGREKAMAFALDGGRSRFRSLAACSRAIRETIVSRHFPMPPEEATLPPRGERGAIYAMPELAERAVRDDLRARWHLRAPETIHARPLIEWRRVRFADEHGVVNRIPYIRLWAMLIEGTLPKNIAPFDPDHSSAKYEERTALPVPFECVDWSGVTESDWRSMRWHGLSHEKQNAMLARVELVRTARDEE